MCIELKLTSGQSETYVCLFFSSAPLGKNRLLDKTNKKGRCLTPTNVKADIFLFFFFRWDLLWMLSVLLYVLIILFFCFQLSRLYRFIEQKGEASNVFPFLNTVIKQKPVVTQLLKHGMKDLEEIIGLLKQLGIKLQVCKILC